jgi:acetoin utilization deacetylase AcuC-like enzyme
VVYDEIFHRHDTGPWHPESPQRLKAVEGAIEGLADKIVRIPPREASREDLLLVHSPEYIERIFNIDKSEIVMLDPDTAFSPQTREVSLAAVGGVLEAADRIMKGEVSRAFCAVRPPGHHAERDRAMGFCIFNNVAVGAAYIRTHGDIEKIAIVDWDLHHGNGTQRAFYDRDDIMYISLHQFPYYPGSGSSVEKGSGKGVGYTLNIPMNGGAGDEEYRSAFRSTVLPALEKFEPDVIFISAGFDAHRNDPLGSMNLSSEFYGEMTKMLRDVADRFGRGRIISVLEGGYDPVALRESVTGHLTELLR